MAWASCDLDLNGLGLGGVDLYGLSLGGLGLGGLGLGSFGLGIGSRGLGAHSLSDPDRVGLSHGSLGHSDLDLLRWPWPWLLWPGRPEVNRLLG